MCENIEKRGIQYFIGKMVNFGKFHYLMNIDGFQLKRGQWFWESHRTAFVVQVVFERGCTIPFSA